MLHEILLALMGLTGSIIIEIPLDAEGNLDGLHQLEDSLSSSEEVERPVKFVVNPDLRFLSLAEID